ncbi:MAG: SET domain-containing protein [Ferruginibacter sp.]
MLKPFLYIDDTATMGRGVFTSEKIEADTVIEISPAIVMSKDDRQHLDKTLLHDYIFEWGKNNERCCMALGLVPMYNHSYASNCEYFMDFDEATIMVKTVRAVEPGEELTINYNGDWDDQTKVWFDKNV